MDLVGIKFPQAKMEIQVVETGVTHYLVKSPREGGKHGINY